MAKEQFFYPASHQLFQQLEELSRRSGVSRGQAFEDWLDAMVCALAAETKEAQYLAMIERHKEGKSGKRGCDLMGRMFGQLVAAMEERDADILGDLYPTSRMGKPASTSRQSGCVHDASRFAMRDGG